MAKKISIDSNKPAKSKPNARIQEIKDSIHDDHECCVLITCSKPKEDGKMHVEMMYDGEESLASYLVESAKNAFGQSQSEKSIDSC